MRASRLVSFLLVLQTRGQLTARSSLSGSTSPSEPCSATLRHSRRPASRSSRSGGRPAATGSSAATGRSSPACDAAEAEALFVGPAAELGLGRELAAARLKLLASLPAELQERASRAAQLFHVDTRGWFREEDRVPHAAGASRERSGAGRRLDIRYREGSAVVSRRLDPLGLVLKAGVWYLLARRRGEERVYRVSRIVSARERAEPCDAAAGLRSRRGVDGVARAAFERSRPRSRSRFAFRAARSATSASRAIVEDGERPTVVAQFDGLDRAFHELMAYGPYAEVFAPAELRERIARAAGETAVLYT